MRQFSGSILIATIGLLTTYASLGLSEEHDPVREARRHKDCVAENVAKQDGRSRAAIEAACDKAIADGSYHDPNISLDGMVKSPSPQ